MEIVKDILFFAIIYDSLYLVNDCSVCLCIGFCMQSVLWHIEELR